MVGKILEEEKKQENKALIEAKVLNLLQFARKANQICLGYDASLRAVKMGKTQLLLFAEDTAIKRRKNIVASMAFHHVPILEFSTKQRIGEAFQVRDVGVVAVLDENFASGILKAMGIKSTADLVPKYREISDAGLTGAKLRLYKRARKENPGQDPDLDVLFDNKKNDNSENSTPGKRPRTAPKVPVKR